MADDTNINRILAGLGEVADIVEGRAAPARVYVPDDVDVRAIRGRLNMSQNDFAARFGFGVAAVRDWEQKRRRPEAAARVLLTVIDKAPDVVTAALEAAASNGPVNAEPANFAPPARKLTALGEQVRAKIASKRAKLEAARKGVRAKTEQLQERPSAKRQAVPIGFDMADKPIYR